MKKRIAKKWASRFLKNKEWNPFGVRYAIIGHYVKVMAVFPAEVSWEVWKKASRKGWDGCHWTDPLVLEVWRCDYE